MSTDGWRVGAVRHVLGETSTGVFDGLVLDTRYGTRGLRFVDARQVDGIFADHVVLTVAFAEVRTLPVPSRQADAETARGPDGDQADLHRKLLRAWQLISEER